VAQHLGNHDGATPAVDDRASAFHIERGGVRARIREIEESLDRGRLKPGQQTSDEQAFDIRQ
jgi:hypothetical protein